MEILEKIYKIYEEDLKIEDNPPKLKVETIEKGKIYEIDGNIYVYIWKKKDGGIIGLLVTPYTILAHPAHVTVKTDSPLYEMMKITDIYIHTTEEKLKEMVTDVIEIEKPEKEELERKIEKMVERKKIYHPIREKFIRNEIKRIRKKGLIETSFNV